MRVEAVAVPLVDGGRTGLGAVCNNKESLPIYAESLNVIWFSDFENVDALKLNEFISRRVTLVDV